MKPAARPRSLIGGMLAAPRQAVLKAFVVAVGLRNGRNPLGAGSTLRASEHTGVLIAATSGCQGPN